MNQKIPDLSGHQSVAKQAADQARKITQKWFRSGMDVASKEDSTPVTIADRQAEEAIRNTILDHYPDHGFFGEETGTVAGDAEWQWVTDPIDGTKCFATGMPTFGTLISLLFQGEPVLGLIDHAVLDERWIGLRGQATTHNDRPCRSRETASVAEATVYTTTTDMFDAVSGPQAEKLTKCCKFRVFGGDCYGYGLVAAGFNDMVCEADLKPYDYCALIPVIEGAGGVITDWQGKSLDMDSSGQVLACGCATLHIQAVELLNA